MTISKNNSISYTELASAAKTDLGVPNFIKSSDGVNIAYYSKAPKSNLAGVLLFIHGGGAHSGAGYQHLANGLSAKHNFQVYLMDLRGHGNSEGPRGDAPSREQVWDELKILIDHIKTIHKDIPIYLGGHSSGCGLILNYLSWKMKSPVDGYIFISPYFGYKSKTEKKNNDSFTKVRLPLFVMNGITQGLMFGRSPAVFFGYGDELLKNDPLLLKYITCNMSKALTPHDPQGQFKMIDKKFCIFIGENDELFSPEKIIGYKNLASAEIKNISKAEIVKDQNHLSILLVADELIYNFVKE
jgi:pimeloyl-ACP methyl ester carboxylesterase